MRSRVYLLQLLGDLVLPLVHLFSTKFFKSYDLFEQRVALSRLFRTSGSLVRRAPHAFVRIAGVVMLEFALQLLQPCDEVLFCRKQFEQGRNLAASNQVGLANADSAKLHEHFVLLGNQRGKLFSGLHRK